ncbi:hypothetical protein ACMBCN_01185, partial [Candidatus Liberibacter asiaticus]|nr:hypothetical protein [Candidatus Liberibacter asiaticus]
WLKKGRRVIIVEEKIAVPAMELLIIIKKSIIVALIQWVAQIHSMLKQLLIVWSLLNAPLFLQLIKLMMFNDSFLNSSSSSSSSSS